jgi:IclR family transcriptional regulator, mhp operon transcriptional activator
MNLQTSPPALATRPEASAAAPARGTAGVRALVRGLEILRALNRLNGATINQVAPIVGLARGTTHRLFRTLEAEGYIRRDDATHCYYPTLLVRGLGDGYVDDLWVRESVSPVLTRAAKTIKWPLGFSTLNGTMLLLRACTDDLSPFTLKRYTPGHRLTLFNTAGGRVLLAYCEDDQREMLIRYRAKQESLPKAEVMGQGSFARMLTKVQHDGFAHSARPVEGELGVAVSVHAGSVFRGTLSMRYVATALARTEIETEYVPRLKDLARAIGRAIQTAQTSESQV